MDGGGWLEGRTGHRRGSDIRGAHGAAGRLCCRVVEVAAEDTTALLVAGKEQTQRKSWLLVLDLRLCVQTRD